MNGHTAHWQKARKLLDEGLHSCQWWWASCRPWWGTDLPNRGADVLMKTLFNLTLVGLEQKVIKEAHALRKSIERKLADWDSTGKAMQLQKEYMQSHQTVSSLLSFG